MNIGIEIEMPELAPFQQEWLRDQHPIIAIEGATGTGKTYVHIPWFVGQAHQPINRGDEYWWVGPSIDKAREVFNDIVRGLEEAGAVGDYQVNKTMRTIETPQGGVMIFKTGENADLLFGTRNVRLIIVDEFTRCRQSIWTPLLSVSNKTGCPIRFIGNYTGDDTAWHLWIKTMTPLPEFKYYRTTAPDAVKAGIMPQAMFDKAKATLAPPIFSALYLCQGSDDPSLLVTYGAVSDLWTNEHVKEGDKCITADIALHGSDRFVMGVWSGFRLKEVTVLEKKTAKEVEEVLKGKATEHGIGRSRIVYDADGLGAYLNSYLQGAASYQGGTVSIHQQGHKLSYQNLRAQCHFLTADMINARGLFVEHATYREDIERELLATLRSGYRDNQGIFHPGVTAAGQRTIVPKDHPEHGAKTRLGRSPDFSDMIVMRQYLELTPEARTAGSFGKAAAEVRRVKFGSTPRKNFTLEGR